jgi:spore coat protein A
MSISRRLFLAGSAALALRADSPALDPDSLEKFADPLPIPPVAKSAGTRPSPEDPTRHIPVYKLFMRELSVKSHRDLPATRAWGIEGSTPGPTIEARSGEGFFVEWVNDLPAKHLLPVDYRLHGAEKTQPEVRAVIHVHGAKVPPESDGYPEDWYVPGKSRTYYYPNRQQSATLWYHDHAMGINRLNIYAGLFGFYLLRDDVEDSLNLPRGPYEIPLAICDRSFLRDGSLDYPTSGIAGAPWVPEAFGEAMMVNGKLFPHLDVEPRAYRFRILNASNGRFFNFGLSNGQKFNFIGTDQGFLAAPVALERFMIAPGERGDVVIDFSGLAGQRVVLKSDPFELLQFRVAKKESQPGEVSPHRPDSRNGFSQDAARPVARGQGEERRFHGDADRW